jgi:Cellulose biosynthesis protein BcsS
MRRHFLFAAAALVAAPFAASADGVNKVAPVAGTDIVYSHTVFTGGEVARDSWEGYLGTVWALNRDLSRDGVLFRVLGSYGGYTYDQFCPPGGCVTTPLNFDGRQWQGDFMIGYQWIRSQYDVAVYAGVDFMNHNISPNDPQNPVQGSETGFKVALDIETHRHMNLPHYFGLEGSYSTAFDTYYLLGRAGLARGTTIFGAEGWLLGDETGNAQRLGAFVSFERQVRTDLLAEFTISGGYQWVDENGRDCGSFFGSEGAYATLNVTFAFGREQRHVPMK